MDKIFEIGKRFERLLYSTVIITILSFLFYFLSSAISIDKSNSKKIMLSQFIESLSENRAALDTAKKIELSYDKYKSEEDKKSKQQKDKENKETELKLKEINKNRVKLGLAERIIEDEIKEKKQNIEGLNLEEIKKTRKSLGLEPRDSIEGGKRIYTDAYTNILYAKLLHDTELLNTFTENKKSPIEDTIKLATLMLHETESGSVKILDVDTPILVPFSFGDMKSKISLYRIESVFLIFMPALLVIWLGSIAVTRSRELDYITKNANITVTYPHIMNIFYFLDGDKVNNKKESNNFHKIILPDEKHVKKQRSEASFLFYIRACVLMFLSASITIPFYLGVMKVSWSLNLGTAVYIIICASINIIQVIQMLILESKLKNKIFILYGGKNEFI